jgi:hypothetical protein
MCWHESVFLVFEVHSLVSEKKEEMINGVFISFSLNYLLLKTEDGTRVRAPFLKIDTCNV